MDNAGQQLPFVFSVQGERLSIVSRSGDCKILEAEAFLNGNPVAAYVSQRKLSAVIHFEGAWPASFQLTVAGQHNGKDFKTIQTILRPEGLQ